MPVVGGEGFRVDGKVAIVTGAAGGMGRAIVRVLCELGSTCRIADIADASEFAGQMTAAGHKVDYRSLDITRSDAVDAYVAQAENDLGPVSILVNCAGFGKRARFADTSDELWDAQLAVNLSGAFYLMRAVLPGMIAREAGAIVNVASMSGIIGGVPSRGPDGRSGPAYAAAKGGMIALTKWAAREFGKSGVRCNAIAPGPVPVEGNLDNEKYDYSVSDYPIPRRGTPDDMAYAVAYLASPASAWITGEVVQIAGGLGM